MEALRPIRMLSNYLLGEDEQDIPSLPQGLPDDLEPIVSRHVGMLVEFQNTDYALLYLDRLGRFFGRFDVSRELFGEIVDLLAQRMAFNDPPRMAQLVLGRARHATVPLIVEDLYRPEIQEIVAMFPSDQAQTIADVLTRLRLLRGRMRIRVATSRGRRTLALFALFRRIRPMSLRMRRESAAVERWLHMIDRALTRQPEAVTEIVRSASIITGHGAPYRLALANWHLLINSLAKPVFDGEAAMPHLSQVLRRAQETLMQDPSGELFRKHLAELRVGHVERAAPSGR